MIKYQTTQFYHSNSSLLAFVALSILLLDKTKKIYKTGFFAGFLFLIGYTLFFQINKLKITTNFIP